MAFNPSIACFVAIPQSPEFDAVRRAVSKALEKSGVERLEAGNVSASLSPVTSDIIERADFVIAEVSSPSSNSYYVLGIADSLRKPTLMMAQRQAELEADLRSREVLLYGPGDEPKLTEYLRSWVGDVIARQRQRNVLA
jgi:hypothetical protein